MDNNVIKYLVINAKETLGDELSILRVREYRKYIEGIRGDVEGLTVTVLSEKMEYEKVDVKIAGLMELPFVFDGTRIPVVFEGLEAKAWQDWDNKGIVKLSVTATGIRPLTGKQIKLEGGNRE